MKLTTRRDIRSALHSAEGLLPRRRDRHVDRIRDLLATACVALWEGPAGKRRLESTLRRAMIATGGPCQEFIAAAYQALAQVPADAAPVIEIGAPVLDLELDQAVADLELEIEPEIAPRDWAVGPEVSNMFAEFGGI